MKNPIIQSQLLVSRARVSDSVSNSFVSEARNLVCAFMAEKIRFLQPAAPKFDEYYDHWSMLIENLLRSKEYWSLIEDGSLSHRRKPPAEATVEQNMTAQDSKLKDLKVKNYLFQAIDKDIMENILDKSSSKAIWDSMKQKYQGSTKVKRAQLQALRREFELLGMKDDESVNNYFSRTM